MSVLFSTPPQISRQGGALELRPKSRRGTQIIFSGKFQVPAETRPDVCYQLTKLTTTALATHKTK